MDSRNAPGLPPACDPGSVSIIGMARILVEAGATVSAIRAAEILNAGGTTDDAYRVLELAPEPADFATALPLRDLNRERDRVEVCR